MQGIYENLIDFPDFLVCNTFWNFLRIGKEVIVVRVPKKIAGLLFDFGEWKEDLRIRGEVLSARLKYNL